MRPAGHLALLVAGLAACSNPDREADADDVSSGDTAPVDVPHTDLTVDLGPLDSTPDDAIVDLGGEFEAGGPCDSSPILLEDGTWVMYGCEFYHHCYKLRLNGEEVTEELELCGAGGTCIYRLTHTCEEWYLLDDGEMSIIVNGETGIIYTHGRMHTGEPDDLPEALELPLSTVPH
jgi:hypothetical protein